VIPTCVPIASKLAPLPPNFVCEANPDTTMTLLSDVADLPKADGDQLLEYTLGARNINKVGPIAFTLDTANVDFDVSYVNVAWMPAAMGVFGNNQVGYTGTPMTIDAFKTALTNFRTQNMVNMKEGWPQFLRTYEFALVPPPSPIRSSISNSRRPSRSLQGSAPRGRCAPRSYPAYRTAELAQQSVVEHTATVPALERRCGHGQGE
jgi:hypothetical protein